MMEKFLIEKLNEYTFVNTWWMSDFYDEFVEFTGSDFDDMRAVQRAIRDNLNKLVRKGIAEKRRTGEGEGGKSLRGFTHSTEWALKGTFRY